MIREKPVAYARNILAAIFLQSDCDWLLSIDSDMVPPDNLLDIISDDRKLVAAHCHAFQRGKPTPVGYYKTNSEYVWMSVGDVEPGKIYAVDAFGTGCYAVHREVFEKVPQPWFEEEYQLGGTAGPVKIMGEDIAFTNLAKEWGFQPYYDARFHVKHRVEVLI